MFAGFTLGTMLPTWVTLFEVIRVSRLTASSDDAIRRSTAILTDHITNTLREHGDAYEAVMFPPPDCKIVIKRRAPPDESVRYH